MPQYVYEKPETPLLLEPIKPNKAERVKFDYLRKRHKLSPPEQILTPNLVTDKLKVIRTRNTASRAYNQSEQTIQPNLRPLSENSIGPFAADSSINLN